MRITEENPLVLGSASPRRRDLVGRLGFPFIVCGANADESAQQGESPRAYLERIALAKLQAVRVQHDEAVAHAAGILVADTIVVSPGGALLGKPRDDDDARWMVEHLAGATHEVSTRFVLAAIDRGEVRLAHAQTVTTRVTFRALSREEIVAYVATGEGRDKAGAYAVQGDAAVFVERIDGSFTNVVGLPLSEVFVAIRDIGWLGAMSAG